ncbi:helix-turn-helix domain-containing protein [Geobacter sp. AOG2]|uniref:helix-turn-helix domain-containing protein n=1 Tax=Geobacter sp. AOG2 TaxID=1566347 RepID=UPI001CC59C8C|nr:helix-turn-helix domain-containing protein [Geobacter sp. AOG2]GFE62870.1 hypothetical protein AOG2_34590 [Geobacter sp. AOG2]
MDTGNSIRELRLEAGYTQQQLGAVIGVKAAYISALERGQRRPGKKLLPLLCDALAVDEMTILFGPRKAQHHREDQEKTELRAIIERLTRNQILHVLRYIQDLLAAGERNDTYRPFILRQPFTNRPVRSRPVT